MGSPRKKDRRPPRKRRRDESPAPKPARSDTPPPRFELLPEEVVIASSPVACSVGDPTRPQDRPWFKPAPGTFRPALPIASLTSRFRPLERDLVSSSEQTLDEGPVNEGADNDQPNGGPQEDAGSAAISREYLPLPPWYSHGASNANASSMTDDSEVTGIVETVGLFNSSEDAIDIDMM